MSHVDPDLVAMMRAVLRQRSLVERALVAPAETFDHALWQQLTDLGLTRLTLPEEAGGSGAGWPEAAALLAEAASAGAQLPLAESDLLAGPLLHAAGRAVDDSPATVAFLDQDGRARGVPWAAQASVIVVVTTAAGGTREASAVSPGDALVSASPGSSTVPRHDLAVEPDVLAAGTLEVPDEMIEALWLRGALARSLQCVGAMERVLDLCLEHVATRHQFGRALSRFQTVQNLVADIAAEVALSRAAVDAAVSAMTGGPRDRQTVFSIGVAKSCTLHASTAVVRAGHQLHGAIGTTREHPLHLLTLPLLDWRSDFGNAAYWDRRVADQVRRHGTAWELIAPAG